MEASLCRSELRADPLSRCAALLLPKDSLAILPFYQSQADLDIVEQEAQTRFVHVDHRHTVTYALNRDIPYSSSFVLDLTADVDERIRHIIDFTFLPGFTSPTIAVLFQHPQTWTRYPLIVFVRRRLLK